MIWLDEKLFFLINGLAGRSEAADWFMKLVVGEYFIPVAMVMVLVVMWFLGKDIRQRDRNQRAVWTALIGVGFASAAVALSNHFFDRLRPPTHPFRQTQRRLALRSVWVPGLVTEKQPWVSFYWLLCGHSPESTVAYTTHWT